MARLKPGGFKCSWEKSGKTSRGWRRWLVCRLAEGRLQGLLRGVKNRSTRAPSMVPTPIFSDWVERQKVLIVCHVLLA